MFSLLSHHAHHKSPLGPYPAHYSHGGYLPNPNDPTQDNLSGSVWDQHVIGHKSPILHDAGIYGSSQIMPLGNISHVYLISRKNSDISFLQPPTVQFWAGVRPHAEAPLVPCSRTEYLSSFFYGTARKRIFSWLCAVCLDVVSRSV
jgi:hypothetical protein